MILSVQQPDFIPGIGRVAINEWAVRIGHTKESGERGTLTAVARNDDAKNMTNVTLLKELIRIARQ